jgi:hypothetical protein
VGKFEDYLGVGAHVTYCTSGTPRTQAGYVREVVLTFVKECDRRIKYGCSSV